MAFNVLVVDDSAAMRSMIIKTLAMINQLRTQEDTEHLAIVVVSTESSETRIASLRDKCVGFVHKPFKPEDLRSQLIHITGVNHESSNGDGAVSGGGFDF